MKPAVKPAAKPDTVPAAKPDTVLGADGVTRCFWCGDDPLYVRYHDNEWGKRTTDDVRLFEKLCLEGFQAGLAWITILRKRETFRAAFADFVPAKVAAFGARDITRLLADAGIVRHRGKIEATINNAQQVIAQFPKKGAFSTYLWSFAPPASERPDKITRGSIPASTPASHALSKDLRKRGFKFVGPTTMYALMQAMGMVNDHMEACAHRGESRHQ